MSNFELERNISSPEFVNRRFAEIIKATFNLDMVTEQVFDDKRKNGYDEHINQLNPDQPQTVISPQPIKSELQADKDRLRQSISQEEADARKLINSIHDDSKQQAEATLNDTLKDITEDNPDLRRRFNQLDELYQENNSPYNKTSEFQDAVR